MQRHSKDIYKNCAFSDRSMKLGSNIDANSQPNERSFDSSSANTQFFLPKSRTVQEPKRGVPRGQQ